MSELLANRFLRHGAGWVDIATRISVRLRLNAAESGAAAVVWNDACADLSRLRHPLLNHLIDYGYAGAQTTFEAYSAGPPAPCGSGSRLAAHAVRFLESRGICLDSGRAQLSVRATCSSSRGRRERPLGIVLQPRRTTAAVEDVLAETTPPGVAVVHVAGGTGSGLRTLRWQIARAARLHGYVPVCTRLLASMPWFWKTLQECHVCLLHDARFADASAAAAAQCIATLGLASARRHVAVQFVHEAEGRGALAVEPMGVSAMISMVYIDPREGPAFSELRAAARSARGNPGQFLAHLGASPFVDHRPSFSLVHESAAVYDATPAPAGAHPGRARSRRLLFSADARAMRLAARGRHAAAVRVLRRAARVLEQRGHFAEAARCLEQLGWILRDRGQSQAALEQFAKGLAAAPEGREKLSCTIASGVAWTDGCRFEEAEAALRGATAAATLLGDSESAARAQLALARCLLWAERFDEAAQLAESLAITEGRFQVPALAMAARIDLARGKLHDAMAAAARAVEIGAASDPRSRASAYRARAMVYAAAGDRSAAAESVRAGVAEARIGHLPLAGLRLHAVLLRAPGVPPSNDAKRALLRIRTALARGALAPLLRRQLQDALHAHQPGTSGAHDRQQPAADDVQVMLERAYGADDDRGAVAEVCRALLERLRAATVQVTSTCSERRLLARAGRAWNGDQRIAERTVAACGPSWSLPGEVHEAASPVTYGGEVVGVLACRWTAASGPDIPAAVALLRAGALAVAPSVRTLLDRPQLAPAADSALRDLIGSGAAMAAVREAMARAARAPYPVLIDGESGSGKELVARGIHRLSARRDRRLCAVNCAAIADELVEAELFGHARGAFTGAVGERPGLFEEADGGTLFLDEIAELSLRAQAKLLRALQDGEVRRVGENFPRRVDVRVIAATNRQLEEEVQAGRFRADLRFRLDVVRISVPSLRDRPADIPLLAAHFWDEACRRVESRASLSPDTIVALTRYDWPGNVRQLQNVIAALAVHAPRRGRVQPSLLPAHIARSAIPPAATFDAAREEFERRFVRAALAQTGGQRAKAARVLGVTRQGLAKMLRRLRIEAEP